MESTRSIFKTSLLICLLVLTQCTTEQREKLSEIPEPSLDLKEFTAMSRNNGKIPGKYIVVLNNDPSEKGNSEAVRGKAYGLANSHGFAQQNIEFIYSTALQGFSVSLSIGQLKKLEKDGSIAAIYEDKIVALAPPPGKGPGGGGNNNDPTQTTPWGITRVGGGATYTGSGVAWVIDTGIDVDHSDLNVDASRGFSAFTKGKDAGVNDGNGHGTHVAGTIAAINNSIGVIGVAAGATVIPVKVLGSRGSGSTSGVIAGVDHVAANANPGDVANMSLGGGAYEPLDNAVIAAASGGIIFALAAGNDSSDASNSSPARADGANIYTISAMDSDDNFAYFSNYGAPVDYCAPGVSINSTWKDGGYRSINGTSMACPHAAGVLLVSNGNPGSSGSVNGDPDNNPDPIISL